MISLPRYMLRARSHLLRERDSPYERRVRTGEAALLQRAQNVWWHVGALAGTLSVKRTRGITVM
eukprot:1616666-Alexandrium_andersonii.AAC.1